MAIWFLNSREVGFPVTWVLVRPASYRQISFSFLRMPTSSSSVFGCGRLRPARSSMTVLRDGRPLHVVTSVFIGTFFSADKIFVDHSSLLRSTYSVYTFF